MTQNRSAHLRKTAAKSARALGHTLGRWHTYEYPCQRFDRADCVECSKTAIVWMAQTITGPATQLPCPMPRPSEVLR